MQTVGLCLAGFVSAIRITSLLDMGMLRNTCAFHVSSLTPQADLMLKQSYCILLGINIGTAKVICLAVHSATYP